LTPLQALAQLEIEPDVPNLIFPFLPPAQYKDKDEEGAVEPVFGFEDEDFNYVEDELGVIDNSE
jgi:hypothetical protein